MAEPVGALVSEGDHVLVEKRREPAQRAVVRLDEQLREHAHLGGAVPPVGAMHENRTPVRADGVRGARRSLEERRDVCELLLRVAHLFPGNKQHTVITKSDTNDQVGAYGYGNPKTLKLLLQTFKDCKM